MNSSQKVCSGKCVLWLHWFKWAEESDVIADKWHAGAQFVICKHDIA